MLSMLIARPLTKSELLVLTAIGVFLAGAVYVHIFSELPLEYSWARTIELLWFAITDKYFIVMAFFALLSATLVSPHRLETLQPPHQARALTAPCTAAALTLLLLVCTSTSYGLWDYVFLFPVFVLLVAALSQRHLGRELAGLMVAMIVLIVIAYVFTIFKSQLFVRQAPLDQYIINAEVFLFGQPIYLTIADWASTKPLLIAFCDWTYFLFFHHIALTGIFLFACGKGGGQWPYVMSLSLCYLLGAISYFILPGLGPVYFDPSHFSYLSEHAEFTANIQRLLKTSTEQAIHGHLGTIETFVFISCMPSLHMAHETVMLFYSRRSPLMFLFSGLFWVSTFVAALVLGWHYLFDLLAGILLAALVIAISQKIHLPSPSEASLKA